MNKERYLVKNQVELRDLQMTYGRFLGLLDREIYSFLKDSPSFNSFEKTIEYGLVKGDPHATKITVPKGKIKFEISNQKPLKDIEKIVMELSPPGIIIDTKDKERFYITERSQ